MSKVRVRFAPSPTGLLHLGAIRTALFNWLFARQNNGSFILRFEDTDQARLVTEAVANTQQSLKWLGLDWDEGPQVGGQHAPYVQSKRLDIYKKYAKELLDSGRLYRDWTAPEDLHKMRQQAQKQKQPFRVERQQLVTSGDPNKPHVLRFKIDPSHDPDWQDLIRGKLSQPANELDDFVAIKSDGFPTYNFANVIDDHQMEISHVIRGEEFIASTPKFLQVYKAFGWQPPQYAHLPQVLGPDKAKLSKRHGAEPVLSYRHQGYLPEAIINFLALLGWNPGTTQELFTPKELIKSFSLERIQKSPAVFDSQRLDWFNGQHIRQLSPIDLRKKSAEFWPKQAKGQDQKYNLKVTALIQDRLKHFDEIPALTNFFYADPNPSDAHQVIASHRLTKKLSSDQVKKYLSLSAEKLKQSKFDEDMLEQTLRGLAKAEGVSPGVLFMLIRAAVCGTDAAPPLFETLATIGREHVLSRLEQASKIN